MRSVTAGCRLMTWWHYGREIVEMIRMPAVNILTTVT